MGRRKEEISKPYKLYKTTNLINNRYYIGVHKTWLNSNFGTERSTDNYLGSGIMILKAIDKYGRENFKVEILEEFDLEEDAYNRENEIITWKWLKENHNIVYNVIPGGGAPPVSTTESAKKAYQTMLTNGTFSKPPVHIGANNCMSNSEFVALYRSGENHHHAKDSTIRIRVKESNIKTHNTKEMKEKISKIQKETHNTEEYKNKRVKCSHCPKEGHISIMSRWHLDNCRYKK